MMWSNIVVLLFVCNIKRMESGDLFQTFSKTLDKMGLFEENGDSKVLPEAILSTIEIIQHFGYPAETHHVITDDGYILEIHRIPGNKYNSTGNKRRPVLLQHAFLCSSSSWLLNGVRDSLGFVLADDSYDTWLGNFRGNTYSRQHVSMSTDDKSFFDFNLDHHALLDLPAIIDYILKITGSEKLTYIGHSLGATVGLILLAEKPEYNEKVNLAALLAPVIYGKFAKHPFRIIATNLEQFTKWYQLLGTNELTPFRGMIRTLTNSLFTDYPGLILCELFIKMFGGYNEQLFDPKRVHVLAANGVEGSSWNIVTHFTQFFARPARFDYGHEVNFKKYGQMQPPAYNFSKIFTKLAIFYGYMDLFIDVQDIQTLVKQLRNVQVFEKVTHETWNHLDFIVAIDARKHFHERLVQVIKQFE